MKNILDYYIDYERENRFINCSLKNRRKMGSANETDESKDCSLKDLKDLNTILKIIDDKKIEKIQNHIKSNLKFKNITRLNEDVKSLISHRNVEEFINKCEFQYEKSRPQIIKEVSDILNDNKIIICYPLLEKRYDKNKSKLPLVTFECIIDSEELKVQKYNVNKEAISIILASIESCEVKSLEDILGNEFTTLFETINGIENQDNIDTIIDIINAEIFKIVNSSELKSINDFKEYEGWIKLERVFVTCEELSELYEPIFRDEITNVMKRSVDDKEDCKILNQYIKGTSKTYEFNLIENNFKFHFGSYTDEYPINEKQWHIVNEVDNINLLSVNGPPGTGKTTLLKEIIADNIVKKAKRLIDLFDQEWKSEEVTDKKIFYSPLGGKNLNSMIITSANNKAVDNIGKELLEEIDYFSEFAQGIKDQDINYKGFLCARLGKSDNMNFFRVNVLHSLLKGLNQEKQYQPNKNIINEFIEVYEELQNSNDTLNSFYKSRKELLEILQIDEKDLIDIEQIKEELDLNHTDLSKKYKYKKEEFNSKTDELNKNLDLFKIKAKKLHEKKVKLQVNDEAIKELYINANKFEKLKKIKFLKLFSKNLREFFNTYPTKQYIDDEIINRRQLNENLETNIENYIKENISFQENINHEKNYLIGLEKKINIMYNSIIKLENHLNKAKNYLNEAASIDNLLETKDSHIKNSYYIINKSDNEETPCNKIVKNRKKIFDLALKVHEEYIKKHSNEIINNLELLIFTKRKDEKYGWFEKFFRRDYKYAGKNKQNIMNLWETLFLCFPVITTTLHSFNKNNFQLIPDLIDLLLVDESGQIMPHMLVGPLYRAKSAVIVGDVKQLRPIVPLNQGLIEKHKNIDDKIKDLICVEQNSVQSYADRNSDIYETDDRNNTKGIVLNEHRRCEESIIAFSNEHVYDKCLKIVKKDDHNKPFGRNNVFFDVRGLESKNHVNSTEVDACVKIIELLEIKGVRKEDIAIITPFKNQSEVLKNKIEGIAIGTIHTFQGQEKKYVIISTVVDGRNSRLVNFIDVQPNMLNVAFTRAKSQLIIVGNYGIACESKNYLKNVSDVIRERGYIYSFYDTELSKNIPLQNRQEGLRVLIDTDEVNELKESLSQVLEGGFIRGSKNHYEALKKLIENAKKSIYIVSPWINHYVVNNEILSLINAAIEKNINIKIYFGYKNSQYSIENIKDIVNLDLSLDDAAKQCATTSIEKLRTIIKEGLIYTPPMHTKMVFVDEKHLIIGSHNWLSNNGNSKENREELSVFTSETEKINYIKDQYFSKENMQ